MTNNWGYCTDCKKVLAKKKNSGQCVRFKHHIKIYDANNENHQKKKPLLKSRPKTQKIADLLPLVPSELPVQVIKEQKMVYLNVDIQCAECSHCKGVIVVDEASVVHIDQLKEFVQYLFRKASEDKTVPGQAFDSDVHFDRKSHGVGA